MSCRMWSTVLWHTPTSAANSRAVHRCSTSSKKQGAELCGVQHGVVLNDGCPEWKPSIHGKNSAIVPLIDMANISITTCFSKSLKTGLCFTTSWNLNFYTGALVLFRKHIVRALELDFYTSRRCTMQLNQTQPIPLTVLLN